MRHVHVLHGWNHAFSNFIIHKVLFQLLQATSISAIHVQSTQSIVLKVALGFKLFDLRSFVSLDGMAETVYLLIAG